MANPKIEVEIGAVIDGLRKGFGESVKIIETLEKQALDLDKALKAATDLPTIQNLNSQLAQTKAALSQLKNSGIDPLTKATSNYNSVGVDFARIIQDAPFGIIGVGNNITQLAGSFQVLKNSTGSTSAALKQSLASIFSSGNALVLGISLLTTAFTILQQKGFFNTEKAAKSLDDQLKDYQETLGSVEQATLKGIQNSDAELQKFKNLTAQAQNRNTSDKNRLAAVNELQKQYPSYLGNLTKEQILTGQVGDSYDALTKQIIANAKAKAFSDEITQNSSNLRVLEKQQLDTANQILQKRIELEKAKAVSTESAAKVSGQLAATDLTVSKITSEINGLIETQIKSINDSNKIKETNLELDGLINKELQNGAVFTKDLTDANKEGTAAVKAYSKAWDEYNEKLRFTDELTLLLGENSARLSKEVDGIFAKRVQEIELSLPEGPIGLDLDKLSESIIITPEIADIDNSKKSAFIGGLKQFNEEASNIITNGAVNGLGDIGFAIGEALATGGNVAKAAGKALLGGIATIAEQLGQAAIKVGVGMISIKMAFKNPATAIAAGVALIALAGFIRAKIGGGGGGGGITSGIGGGGGGASVGDSGVGGGTSFAGGGQGGLFAQNRDLNGELVVRGQDLVYVFGQASNRINKG
jgi:hypothetical protein